MRFGLSMLALLIGACGSLDQGPVLDPAGGKGEVGAKAGQLYALYLASVTPKKRCDPLSGCDLYVEFTRHASPSDGMSFLESSQLIDGISLGSTASFNSLITVTTAQLLTAEPIIVEVYDADPVGWFDPRGDDLVAGCTLNIRADQAAPGGLSPELSCDEGGDRVELRFEVRPILQSAYLIGVTAATLAGSPCEAFSAEGSPCNYYVDLTVGEARFVSPVAWNLWNGKSFSLDREMALVDVPAGDLELTVGLWSYAVQPFFAVSKRGRCTVSLTEAELDQAAEHTAEKQISPTATTCPELHAQGGSGLSSLTLRYKRVDPPSE